MKPRVFANAYSNSQAARGMCLVMIAAFGIASAFSPLAAAAQGQPGIQAGTPTTVPADQPLAPPGPEAANEVFSLRVTVEQVDATNDFDGPFDFDRADFFAVLIVAGEASTSGAISNADHIRPNWQLTRNLTVPNLTNDLVTFTLMLRDSDDCGTLPTCGNVADLTPNTVTEPLLLTVDISACAALATGAVSGSVAGNCGTTLFSAGGAPANTAEIRFRVEATPPASAPGLELSCLHDPIWPQPGQSVTLNTQALDGSLQLRLVTNLELWVNDPVAAARVCDATDSCNTTLTAGPNGSSFDYRCVVRDGAVTISSGWRRVQVGSSSASRAVPVLFTGERAGSIDLIFIPDSADYPGGANDGGFQLDVQNLIVRDLLSERTLLQHQDQLNLWIATDTGRAFGFPNNPCVQGPGNWGSDYAWADAGVVIHRAAARDCATRGTRLFSAQVSVLRAILHEFAHSPFGLEDEYCCDSSYLEPSTNPNIYDSLAECQADIPNLQGFDLRLGEAMRSPAACRQISSGASSIGFWTSEPIADDLMLDGGSINGADLRRFEALFQQCGSASCGQATAQASGATDHLPPPFDFGSMAKVVAVDLAFTGRTTATVSGVQVIYSPMPAVGGNPAYLRVIGRSAAGSTLSEHHMWHPLMKAGSIVPGFEFDVDHDPTVWLSSGSARIVLPFRPNLASVTITDEVEQVTIAAVGVADAIRAFCRANPTDLDCAQVDTSYHLQLPFIQR